MNPLRAALEKFFGEHNASAEAVQKELHALRMDTLIETLVQEGHLAADEETRQAARRMAEFDAEGLARLVRSPRAVPAQTTVYTPAQTAPADPVQSEIERTAAEKGIPYHEAAALVSRGGRIG